MSAASSNHRGTLIYPHNSVVFGVNYLLLVFFLVVLVANLSKGFLSVAQKKGPIANLNFSLPLCPVKRIDAYCLFRFSVAKSALLYFVNLIPATCIFEVISSNSHQNDYFTVSDKV